jgi:hypothetical protein
VKDSLHPAALAVALCALAVLLPGVRRFRRDPALAALTGVVVLSAVSFAVSTSAVWTRLDRASGTPDISALVAHLCVVGLIVCQQVVLALWGPPQEARRAAVVPAAAGAAVAVTLAVLFTLLPRASSHPVDFTAYYDHSPVYRVYLTVYTIAYTLGGTSVARACWRHARRTDQVWVARGLYMVMAGSVATLGYSGVRIGGVAAVALGTDLSGWEPTAWLCGDVGTILTLAGWALPTVADALAELRTRLREHAHYRRLRPLWSAMHRLIPAIALDPARNAATDRLRLRDIGWHLDRRAVEIRDGQRALRHHLCPAVRQSAETRHQAAGLTGPELAAAVTAEQIRHAISAMSCRQAPHPAPTDYAETYPVTATPTDEVHALLRIAAHFTTAPAGETS